MTNSDDRLAPVIPIFGDRPSSESFSAAQRLSPRHPVFGSVPADPIPTADELAEEYGGDVDSSCAELTERDRTADRAARRAENVAMHALTRRSLSRREVERTLRQRELDDAAIEAEVTRLEGAGLIDDLALAQHLVGTLQERKALGRSAIAAELTRRMLSPAAIEYALELVDSGDELARARDLAAKRAPQLRGLDRETAVRRLTAYLARRGYGGSTLRSAVDAALASSGSTSSVRFR